MGMAPRNIRKFSVLILILAICMAFLPYQKVHALSGSAGLPALEDFTAQLKDGKAGILRGVYIPEIMAARVVQQPEGHSEFVSPRANILTQFSPASKFGSTGLLAHNYLAGASFSLLKPGQVFYLVYGDGVTSAFIVKEILSFQAVNPLSTTSDFVDLKTSKVVSAAALMNSVYNRPGQVAFQTCIARNGQPSWGRLFIIAEPYAAK
jgi:hypothetical protein